MKIGYDAKQFFNNGSGTSNYSRNLIRILAQNLPENEYLLLDKKPSDGGHDILEFENVTLDPSPSGLLSRQLHIGTKAQLNNCDIFHGLTGELPLKWDDKPIKKVVTVHDLLFMIYPNNYSFVDRKIQFVQVKKAMDEADVVVAVSEQTKKDIITHFHVREKKIKVIYQGCNQLFKKTYTELEMQEVRKKFGLPKQFLLNVAKIEKHQNGLSIVKAIKGTAIPVVFIGLETPYARTIKKFVEENKLNKQVQFLKNISDQELAIIYQMASVFIYPSIYEGFAPRLLEALFSKIPVITNRDGGFSEAGGLASIYVDVNNIENINLAIVDLWTNENRRKEIADKGFQFVQKFNDEFITKEWDTLYNSLLN